MSLMLEEIWQAPGLVRAALDEDGGVYDGLGRALRRRPPGFVATIARGSSDHAALYAAGLIAIRAGRATASVQPSWITRYDAGIDLSAALVLAISQSGASPDLVEAVGAARQAGGLTVALVNETASDLAREAAWVLPQRAGPEKAVAATKSFILSLVAVARLVAAWTEDAALAGALAQLPDRLEAALGCDWSAGLDAFGSGAFDGGAFDGGAFVVARGPALAIAHEAALKLKETCTIHAEAMSAAEIRHGPFAVLGEGFPVLGFALDDAGGADTHALAGPMTAAGARVLMASARGSEAGLQLALPPSLHPLLDPIVAITAFYPFAEALARRRGLDPDRPRHLRKVTRTL